MGKFFETRANVCLIYIVHNELKITGCVQHKMISCDSFLIPNNNTSKKTHSIEGLLFLFLCGDKGQNKYEREKKIDKLSHDMPKWEHVFIDVNNARIPDIQIRIQKKRTKSFQTMFISHHGKFAFQRRFCSDCQSIWLCVCRKTWKNEQFRFVMRKCFYPIIKCANNIESRVKLHADERKWKRNCKKKELLVVWRKFRLDFFGVVDWVREYLK